MDRPAITYAPRADASPEAELGALAAVYAMVLESRTSKEAAPRQSRPENAEESSDALDARRQYTP